MVSSTNQSSMKQPPPPPPLANMSLASSLLIHRFTLSNLFKYLVESPCDVHGLLIGNNLNTITDFIVFNSSSGINQQQLLNMDLSKCIIIGYFKYRSDTNLNTFTMNEMNTIYYLLNNIVKRDGMIVALFSERMISNQQQSYLNNNTIEHYYSFRNVNYSKRLETSQNVLPLQISKPIPVKIENLINTTCHLKYRNHTKELPDTSAHNGNSEHESNNRKTHLMQVCQNGGVQRVEEYFTESVNELQQLTEQIQQARATLAQLRK